MNIGRAYTTKIKSYLVYSNEIFFGYQAQGEQLAADKGKSDLMNLIDLNQPQRALDLGNGRLCPQSYLLAKDGHTVVGVDLLNQATKSPTDLAYRLYRKIFRRQIGISARELNRIMLVAGDVTRLPISSSTFDFASSQAAFEHFLDVDLAVTELHRVLKHGAAAWVSICLFSSFSGGHNIYEGVANFKSHPKGFKPWRHLLDRSSKQSVPLNRWRSRQYIECFQKHFRYVSWYFDGSDGTVFIIPEISQRLRNFSIEQLTANLKIVLQK